MNSADSTTISLPGTKKPFAWKRLAFMLLGMGLFAFVYYCPPWPDAIDPMGEHFVLSQQAKGALGIFLLAATWWVFEVVPIGVTSLTIGVLQALFMIREPKVAFKDFMDPSVLFIFGSIVIGMVFTKTGLTRRIAYSSKMFTTGEFFLYGIPARILLMLVTWLAVSGIWPLMGMEVFVPKII